jgi:hypothetical protein
VQVEHARGDVSDVGQSVVDRRRDLVLRRLARRIPRRPRREPDGDHLVVVVEVHDHALARDDASVVLLGQDVEHGRRVVVPAREEDADVGVVEALARERDPAAQPLASELLRLTLDEQRVVAERRVLVGLDHLPVVAGDLDPVGDRADLGDVHLDRLAGDLGAEPVPAPDDRHERLAHQVAAEDECVGAVERGGVHELPPRRRRPVQVRGVEHAGSGSTLEQGHSARLEITGAVRRPPPLERVRFDATRPGSLRRSPSG